MGLNFYTTTMLLLFVIKSTLFCQGLNINKSGIQTFYFKDPQNRNQASFTSDAPFESFTGVATDIGGEISFDPIDIKNTMKGEIFISVNSFKTGIEMRDKELKGDGWLESAKYPIISFKLDKVNEVIIIDKTKIELTVEGSFSCHGKKNRIMLNAILTFLEENELTKKRIPGDLLSVVTHFNIKLSDYGIKSIFIPHNLSDEINVFVNIIGTNVKPE